MQSQKTTENNTISDSEPHSQQPNSYTDADAAIAPKKLKQYAKMYVATHEETREPLHNELSDNHFSDYRNMPNYINRHGEPIELIYIIQNHLQLYSVVEFAHTLNWMVGKLVLSTTLTDLQKMRLNEVSNAADYLFLLSKLNNHEGDEIEDVLN